MMFGFQCLKKPRLRIAGVEDELSELELRECLAGQNSLLKDLKLKLITSYQSHTQGFKSHNYIIEVDINAHCTMLELGRVNIGWERRRVFECFGIIRCFKCCGYGHKSADCKSDETCGKCAGSHRSAECSAEELSCTNCAQMNRSRKLNMNANHHAFSEECPMYKRLVARKRQQIAYVT